MKKRTPYVTYGVIILCCVMYGIMSLIDSDDIVVKYILCGANYKPFILAGDYYRLLTAGFIHANIIHLFVNMISLYSIGKAVESLLGRKYIILLLTSIIFSNLFVLTTVNHTVTLGISGGIYGLLAFYIYFLCKKKLYRIPKIKQYLILMILMNLMLNFIPGVSWIGHLGGFVSGFFVSIFLTHQYESKEIVKHCTVAFIILCLSVGYMDYKNREIPSNQIYYGTDLNVLNISSQYLPYSYIQSKAKRLDAVYQNGKVLESIYQ